MSDYNHFNHLLAVSDAKEHWRAFYCEDDLFKNAPKYQRRNRLIFSL